MHKKYNINKLKNPLFFWLRDVLASVFAGAFVGAFMLAFLTQCSNQAQEIRVVGGSGNQLYTKPRSKQPAVYTSPYSGNTYQQYPQQYQQPYNQQYQQPPQYYQQQQYAPNSRAYSNPYDFQPAPASAGPVAPADNDQEYVMPNEYYLR